VGYGTFCEIVVVLMKRSAAKKRDGAAPVARTTTPKKRGTATEEARTRTRLDVDERRQQLIALGLAEFGTQTYDDVSIDLIAQRAGISKGLLYHYFPTKRAFYVACVREAAGRLVSRLNEVDEATRHLSPLDQLTASLDAYLVYVRSHGPAFATLMRGGSSIDREIGAVVDETRNTLLDLLTKGMNDFFPSEGQRFMESPLMRIALHGWVGLAEASSIAWVEACVIDETRAPTAAEVRDLLASSLVTVVQGALR